MVLKKRIPIVIFGFMVLSVHQSWSSKTPLSANSSIKNNAVVKETEKALRLSKSELEKMSTLLTEEQKSALRQIAFNENSDLQIRWRALVLSARLQGDKVKADINQAAKSSEWFMRSAAMMAANEISSDEGIVLARKLVNDKALVVRSAAVDILGNSGAPSDRNLLWAIIKDPINKRKGQSLWIRSQALQILAKSPQKSEVPQYISLLKENDVELQAISIHALELVSDVQFGTVHDRISDHRKRWLQWWELSSKSKVL